MADQQLDLDTPRYSWEQAKEKFLELYHSELSRTGKNRRARIDVIHGYGSSGTGGVIKDNLRSLLEQNANCLSFTLGESIGLGEGLTRVIPQHPIPGYEKHRRPRGQNKGRKATKRVGSAMGTPEADILAYCSKPRSRTQIDKRMRKRIVLEEIDRILRALVAQGKFVETRKGDEEAYIQTSPES